MEIIKQNVKAIAITAIAILILLVGLIPNKISVENPGPVIIEEPEPTISHAQEVWINVLEWCESRGYPDAINEEDLDGTPSYGAFQFKPSTLDYYAEMYGVATTTLMDYETQKAVVTQMVLHRDEINWNQQFPWCVKKFGPPPA